MSARSSLADLLGPAPHTPPPVDWDRTRQELGFPVPADFREWATDYPQLRIDAFLTVLHPAGPAPNLLTAGDDLLVLDRLLKEADPDDIPYPLHPEPGGLYPWGTTGNSERLHWYPAGNRVVVIGRSGNWEHPGTMTRFLEDILTRQVICPLFPDTFPRPGFTTTAV
ncbi:hypothetical protein ACPB9E_36495 [Streptomyces exfoliatus]|uniref:hypothetical protein n=1 Tax=Streptomyces exfoliatus TaxID=1905 RepID=UPI003C2E1B23